MDPADIVIANGSDATGDPELSTQSGNIPSSFTSGVGEPFTISETAIETLLTSGKVSLEATNTITLQDLVDNVLGDPSTAIVLRLNLQHNPMDRSGCILSLGG